MLRSWLSDHGLLWPCGVAELAHGELHRIVGQRRKCLAFAAVGSLDHRAAALVINRPALRKFKIRSGESCGSSVVEHSLGKGEAESSILSRSTSFLQ